MRSKKLYNEYVLSGHTYETFIQINFMIEPKFYIIV